VHLRDETIKIKKSYKDFTDLEQMVQRVATKQNALFANSASYGSGFDFDQNIQ
jgi:hypothetical protein